LGLPVAGSILLEVLVFSMATVLAGRISVTASAAHGIALNFASLTFMVPLALASTASVKVSFHAGQKIVQGVRDYSMACLIIAVGFMALSALSFGLIPGPLVALATNESAIAAYTVNLLFFVGIFQIPDGVQVTLSGVLRGLGKTKGPMIAYFLSYWPLGLPMAYILAFRYGLEAKGLWLGLMAGVYAMAISLGLMYRFEIKKLRSVS
jgi:MATE family multidrug resistance protein